MYTKIIFLFSPSRMLIDDLFVNINLKTVPFNTSTVYNLLFNNTSGIFRKD